MTYYFHLIAVGQGQSGDGVMERGLKPLSLAYTHTQTGHKPRMLAISVPDLIFNFVALAVSKTTLNGNSPESSSSGSLKILGLLKFPSKYNSLERNSLEF